MIEERRYLVRDGEQLCDLQREGLFLIQSDRVFHFGTDAVLLSDFAKIKKNAKVADLGTGTGILPLLLSAKTEASHITGFEIREESADCARRSVMLNGLEDRIDIVTADIRELTKMCGKTSFDAIVTNPPYKRAESGIRSDDDVGYIARHEALCTLEDVISVSADLLVPYGDFYMVNRPERLADALELMRKYRIEPKLLQFVAKNGDSAPVLFLVHGVYLGGKNLRVLPQYYTSGR